MQIQTIRAYAVRTPIEQTRAEGTPRGCQALDSIKRVAYAFFAVLAFLVGTDLASGGTLLGLSLAIPLYLIGTALGWEVFNWDGNGIDLSKIPEIKKQMRRRPLKEMIAVHGIKDIFRYNLLSRDFFEKKFAQMLGDMRSIHQIIRTYQYVQSKLPAGSPLRLAHPNQYTGIWRTEVRQMKVSEVLDKYDLDLLRKYHILAKDPYNALKDADRTWTRAREPHIPTIQKIEQTFKQAIKSDLRKFQGLFETQKKQIRANLDPAGAELTRSMKKTIEYLNNSKKSGYSKKALENTNAFLEARKLPSEPIDIHKIRMEFIKEIKDPIIKRNDALRDIQKDLTSTRKKLHSKYKWALS